MLNSNNLSRDRWIGQARVCQRDANPYAVNGLGLSILSAHRMTLDAFVHVLMLTDVSDRHDRELRLCFKSSCSKADAIRSISNGAMPRRTASRRH